MYAVVCNYKNMYIKEIDDTQYLYEIGSYKNAYEFAMDKIIELLTYLQGFKPNDEIFRKCHPTSTFLTPKYYCLCSNDNLDKFRIFKHIKNQGILFSSHRYEKISTFEIIFMRDSELSNDYNNFHEIPTPTSKIIKDYFNLINLYDQDSEEE